MGRNPRDHDLRSDCHQDQPEDVSQDVDSGRTEQSVDLTRQKEHRPDHQDHQHDDQREDPVGDSVGTIGMTMEEIEKEAIRKTLGQNSGNKKKTAEILGIGLRTLYRKLESYGWINAEREL